MSQALTHVVVWPASERKNPVWTMARGSDTSMMCTAPLGKVEPEVAGVVNPRGSRLMNSRLRTRSTSMSSFSQMYIGRAPSSVGLAGSVTS